MLLFVAFFFTGYAHAQRYVPGSGNWSDFSSEPGHALGQGDISGSDITGSSGSLEESGVTDSGFFRYIGVKEGDELQTNVVSPSTTGVSGLMVRDNSDADAAFAFAGQDESGNTIVLIRRTAGEPVKKFEYGAAGSNTWVRMLVGSGTVYLFDAANRFTVTNGHNNWALLGAFEVDLQGTDDIAGPFVENGTTTFPDIIQTRQYVWSERTSTTADAVQTPGATWTSVAPTTGQEAISGTLLTHSVDTSGDSLEFPITINSSGLQDFYIHSVAGNPSSINAEVIVNSVSQGIVSLTPDSTGNEWLYIGRYSASSGESCTIRVFTDAGTSGATIYADAARSMFQRELTWHYPGWTQTGSTRIKLSNSGTSSNLIYRSTSQADNWNAGGYYSYALIGDGVYRARVPVTTKRLIFGLTTSPSGSGYTNMQYRYYAQNNGTASIHAGGSGSFGYSGSTWFVIERIGSQVYFYKDATLVSVSNVALDVPLYIDCAIYDNNGKLRYSGLQGRIKYGSYRYDIDQDGTSDSGEQFVIDADPEDGIQSIYDVDMSGDPDGDGLTNAEEGSLGTDPTDADTDDDGLTDGEEVNTYSTDPLDADSDNDGLTDGVEVNSAYGFDPNDADTDDDAVGDYTEWEIIDHAQNDDNPYNDGQYDGQEDIDGTGDFDGDGVTDGHESDDRTSAVDAEDYFFPVEFGRLGETLESDVTLDTSVESIDSTRIKRSAGATSGDPAGGLSHHWLKDGSRLRFQVAEVAEETTIGISYLFEEAGLPDAGDEPNYNVSIATGPTGKTQVLSVGQPVPIGDPQSGVTEFDLLSTDLMELRLEMNAGSQRIVVARNFTDIAEIPLSEIDLEDQPMLVVVSLPDDDAEVFNLRYRLMHDPDTDDDGLLDSWEQEIVDAYPYYTSVDDVLGSGDEDGDGLINSLEFQLGSKGHLVDSDGDSFGDWWEYTFGYDPAEIDSGLDAADTDGDGLSDMEEYDLYQAGILVDPNLPDTDSDELGDKIEVAIIDYDEGDSVVDLATALPGDDVDLDEVSNLDELIEETSPVDTLDHFDSIRFDGLGLAENVDYVEALDSGLLSAEIDYLEPGFPGELPAALAHHRLKNGSRVRFRFADPSKETVVGIALAETLSQGSVKEPEFQLSVAEGASGELAISSAFDSSVALGSTVTVTETDVIELAVHTWDAVPRIIVKKNGLYVTEIPFSGVSTPSDGEMVIAVVAREEGAGIRGGRYYKVIDVDANENGISDYWEQEYSLGDPDGDSDGDGLRNFEEFEYGTDPTKKDSDGDGVTDFVELYHGLDPMKADSDLDDFDLDGVPTITEYEMEAKGYNFSPMEPDSDFDGLGDRVEFEILSAALTAGDPISDVSPEGDYDGDGLTNAEEDSLGTSSLTSDTDGDGLQDWWEAQFVGIYDFASLSDEYSHLVLDPTVYNPDPDLYIANSIGRLFEDIPHTLYGEGRSIWEEHESYYATGILTSPYSPDTDGDGVFDSVELRMIHSDPNDGFETLADIDGNGDFDQDGLADGDEYFVWFTDPTSFDSDGDSYLDGWEVEFGFAPDPFRSDDFVGYPGYGVTARFDPDQDGLHVKEEHDAWYEGVLISPTDRDSDDDFVDDGTELAIIRHDPSDAYATLEDVNTHDDDGIDPFDEQDDFDGDGSSNVQESLNWSDATEPLEFFNYADITWAALTNAVSDLGTKPYGTPLRKSVGADAWDASALSTESIPANTDGAVQFDVMHEDKTLVVGLSDATTVSDYNDIDFGIYFEHLSSSDTGHYEIWEAGVPVYGNDNHDHYYIFDAGDRFAVRRREGEIDYLRNGIVIYTSAASSTTELKSAAAFYSGSSSPIVEGVRIMDYVADTDVDGYIDAWEREIVDYDPNDQFTVIEDVNGTSDFDGDDLTLAEELAAGTDYFDDDTDDDGVSDSDEITNGLNPLDDDTDGDGMSDGWEITFGFDPLVHRDTDPSYSDHLDGDDLKTNYEESYYIRSGNLFNPFEDDSDGDGLRDDQEWEIMNSDMSTNAIEWLRQNPGANPFYDYPYLQFADVPGDGDFDKDGILNKDELQYATRPDYQDTDQDGYLDGWEAVFGSEVGVSALVSNSTVPGDSDRDGLSNELEYLLWEEGISASETAIEADYVYLFKPNSRDSDGDGVSDLAELRIIERSLTDSFEDLESVLSGPAYDVNGDFDLDGKTNAEESLDWSDPTESDEFYSFSAVTWSDKVNASDDLPGGAYGSSLWKPSSYGESGYDAGATSTEVIAADGLFQFDVETSDKDFVIGLTTTPEGVETSGIEFAIRIGDDGYFQIWESGVPVFGQAQTEEFLYEPGDRFGVHRELERIYYYRNGEKVYKSQVASTGDLRVDVSFFGASDQAMVSGVRLATYVANTDGDSLPDSWERDILERNPFGVQDINLITDGGDTDDDGLSNVREYLLGADPVSNDTDGDGLFDGWEDAFSFGILDPDVTSTDADGDTLTLQQEHDYYQQGILINPNIQDTDGDGIRDDHEAAIIIADPDDEFRVIDDNDEFGVRGDDDFDGDTLSNAYEYTQFTLWSLPYLADSDGDGYWDDWELEFGCNPRLPSGATNIVHPDLDEQLIQTEDEDEDRLTNLEEHDAWRLGILVSPLTADTPEGPNQQPDGVDDFTEVEIANFSSEDDYHTLESIKPNDDFDQDGRTNAMESLDWTDATDSGDAHFYKSVNWANLDSQKLVQGVTESYGTDLRKHAGGDGQWNAAALSERQVAADGGVQFDVREYGNFQIGFSFVEGGFDESVPNIDYALRFQDSGKFSIVEAGGRPSSVEYQYSSGDRFEIRRIDNHVSYLKNGVPILRLFPETGGPGLLVVDAEIADVTSEPMIVGTRIWGGLLMGDSDGDDIPDAWELDLISNANDPLYTDIEDITADGDIDSDGISNLDEYLENTNALEVNDHFVPVSFADEEIYDFGRTQHVDVVLVGDASQTILEETMVSRSSEATSVDFAGALSHDRLVDGSRVRFRFADPAKSAIAGIALVENTYYTGEVRAPEFQLSCSVTEEGRLVVQSLDNPVPKFSALGASSLDVFEFKIETQSATPCIVLERNGVQIGKFDFEAGEQPADEEMMFAVVTTDEGSAVSGARYYQVVDPDTNDDGIVDRWVGDYGVTGARDDDDDADTLTNYEEFLQGTNPTLADSDYDGIDDDDEIYAYHTDPLSEDSDGDGISNQKEHDDGTDPLDFYNSIMPVVEVDRVDGLEWQTPVGSEGVYLLRPLSLTLTDSLAEPVSDAPVMFVVTAGGGSLTPFESLLENREDSTENPEASHLRTDENGAVRVAWKLGSSSEPVQTVHALAKVGGRIRVLHTFLAFSGNSFALPSSTDISAHFSAERGITLSDEGAIEEWASIVGDNHADTRGRGALLEKDPDDGNAWVRFGGVEEYLFDRDIRAEGGTWYALLTADRARTEHSPSTGATSETEAVAGRTGQRFLFSGPEASSRNSRSPWYQLDPEGGERVLGPNYFSVYVHKKFGKKKDTNPQFPHPNEDKKRWYKTPSLNKHDLGGNKELFFRGDKTGTYYWRENDLFNTPRMPGAGLEAIAGRAISKVPNPTEENLDNVVWSWTKLDSSKTASGTNPYTEKSGGVALWKDTYYVLEARNPVIPGAMVFDSSRIGSISPGFSIGYNGVGYYNVHHKYAPALGLWEDNLSSRTVLRLEIDRGKASVAVNGATETAADLSPAGGSLNKWAGLGPLLTSGNGFSGKVAELLHVRKIPSNSEAAAVEDYLASRYWIDHPSRDGGDQLPDWWEKALVGSTSPTYLTNEDDDGWENSIEFSEHTHPDLADSDGDGIDDDEEAAQGTSPVIYDTDRDGLPDGVDESPTDPANGVDGDSSVPPNEVPDGEEYLLDPARGFSDGDNDTIPDIFEVLVYGTSVSSPDSDGDGYFDADELNIHGTNPVLSDSDGDGSSDKDEIEAGTDPNDRNDSPESSLLPAGISEHRVIAISGKRKVVAENEGRVSGWFDILEEPAQVGFEQAGSTKQPLWREEVFNLHPAVAFQPGEFLGDAIPDATLAAVDAFHLASVISIDSAEGTGALFGTEGGIYLETIDGVLGVRDLATDQFYPGTIPLTRDVPHYVAIDYDSSVGMESLKVYVDDRLEVEIPDFQPTLSQISIGGRDLASADFDGHMAEFLLVDKHLEENDRLLLRGKLASKYDIDLRPASSLTLVSPVDGAMETAPAQIRFKVDFSDPVGEVSEVRYFQNSVLLESAPDAPFELIQTDVGVGTHSFYAELERLDGVVSTSNIVTVIVSEPAEPADRPDEPGHNDGLTSYSYGSAFNPSENLGTQPDPAALPSGSGSSGTLVPYGLTAHFPQSSQEGGFPVNRESIILNWKAPLTGGTAGITYEIFKRRNGGPASMVHSTSSLTWTDDTGEVFVGDTYEYTVRIPGNGQDSEVISVPVELGYYVVGASLWFDNTGWPVSGEATSGGETKWEYDSETEEITSVESVKGHQPVIPGITESNLIVRLPWFQSQGYAYEDTRLKPNPLPGEEEETVTDVSVAWNGVRGRVIINGNIDTPVSVPFIRTMNSYSVGPGSGSLSIPDPEITNQIAVFSHNDRIFDEDLDADITNNKANFETIEFGSPFSTVVGWTYGGDGYETSEERIVRIPVEDGVVKIRPKYERVEDLFSQVDDYSVTVTISYDSDLINVAGWSNNSSITIDQNTDYNSFDEGWYTLDVSGLLGAAQNDGEGSTTITFAYSWPDQGHTVTTDVTLLWTDPSPESTSFSISANDAGTPKYRKVSITGLPMSDETPEGASESDLEKEETYIDALTTQLRHSTTDVFIPNGASTLPLTVRRNTTSEVWNAKNGLLPEERRDLPFGRCWSTNLCCYLKFGENTVDVYDQNGYAQQFGFAPGSTKYIPKPGNVTEAKGHFNSLEWDKDGNQWIYKKKFGGTIAFEPMPNSVQYVPKDRTDAQTDYEPLYFARAKYVKDRHGNVLEYVYQTGAPHDIIPIEIKHEGRPGSLLHIKKETKNVTNEQTGGSYQVSRVVAIWDPEGNKTDYIYDANGDLREVHRPDQAANRPNGTVVKYAYGAGDVSEADEHPNPENHVTKYHRDLLSIENGNGETISFDYAFDDTVFVYEASQEFAGYYQQTGLPRVVTKVHLPTGANDYSQFSRPNRRIEAGQTNQLFDNMDGLVSRTTVIDAEEKTRNYTFSDFGFFDMTKIDRIGSTDPPTSRRLVLYSQKLEITVPGFELSSPTGGVETYEFDIDAGLAPKKITDLWGNVTTYTYGDSWAGNSTFSKYFGSRFLKFDDPTKVTVDRPEAVNTTGKMHETFAYDYDSRVMKRIVDREGRTTTYTINNGLRTSETIEDSNGVTLSDKTFSYDNSSFPMFMTESRQKNRDGFGAGDLVTTYTPDDHGRVLNATVDDGGSGLTTTTTYDRNGNKETVTDPNGNVTTFEYDGWNHLTGVTYPDADPDDGIPAESKEIRYDAAGRKYEEENAKGTITRTLYDELGRVREVKIITLDATPDIVTSKTYNRVGSVDAEVDARGVKTKYDYYPSQLPWKVTVAEVTPAHPDSDVVSSPDPQITEFEYGKNSGSSAFNISGFKPTKTTRTRDDREFETYVKYNSQFWPYETRVEYEAGKFAKTATVYDKVGNPKIVTQTITDAVDRVTRTDYDGMNRPVKVTYNDTTYTETDYNTLGQVWKVRDEKFRETETVYDLAGRPTDVYAPEVDNGFGVFVRPTVSTTYDRAGNALSVTDPRGNTTWTYYDGRNRPVYVVAPPAYNAETGESQYDVTKTKYDILGNVVEVTDARGNTTITRYDDLNRPYEVETSAVPYVPAADANDMAMEVAATNTTLVTTTTYDANGNILTVEDAEGNITTNVYDWHNRLVKTADQENNIVKFGYDKFNNRTSVTQVVGGQNQTTTMRYDGLNRLTLTTRPDTTTIEQKYNAFDLVQRIDSLGRGTSYGYDDRGRLKIVSYEQIGGTRVYDYDDVGNITSVTEDNDQERSVVYDYDELYRVTSETSGGVTHTYRYDVAGNLLSVHYGNTGTGIASGYDSRNRLVYQVENGRITLRGYDPNGNLVGKWLPNGQLIVDEYDALNRKSSSTGYEDESQQPSGIQYEYRYGYDKAGNMRVMQEALPGFPLKHTEMVYDGIYRLKEERTTSDNDLTRSVTNYNYDEAGNRTYKGIDNDNNGTDDETWTTIVDTVGLNQIDTVTHDPDAMATGDEETISYSYDDNGNRTTRSVGGAGTHTFDYDQENRLISVVHGADTYSYGYDYRTRRVERVENGTSTAIVFSGGTSVQEYDGVAIGSPSVEYIRGSGMGGGVGSILYSLRGGTPGYNHYNSRGDVVAKTDGAGEFTWKASYEAYGSRTNEDGTNPDRQRANTREETGWGALYENMRWRDLETGMYLTRDPAGFVDGPNLYAYVNQNPWTKFDALGLFESAGSNFEDIDRTPKTIRNSEGKIYMTDGGDMYNDTERTVVNTLEFGSESPANLQKELKRMDPDGLMTPNIINGAMSPETRDFWAKVGMVGPGGLSASERDGVRPNMRSTPNPNVKNRGPGGVVESTTTARGTAAQTSKQVEQYGPFHRLGDDPKIISTIKDTGQLRGNPSTLSGAGRSPMVQAHDGPLPAGRQGFEFTTSVAPYRYDPPKGGLWSGKTWRQGMPGVSTLDNGQAAIPVQVTKVQDNFDVPLRIKD